jgi:hypothetical protein
LKENDRADFTIMKELVHKMRDVVGYGARN